MSLHTLQEDLTKYDFNRVSIANKLIDLLHLEEVSTIFYDLIPIDIDDILVKLDDEATLNIIFDSYGIFTVSIINKETTSTISFKDSRTPQNNILELSEFYHKLEPYKEILEDKIEEGFRKEIELDKFVKKEN